MSTGLTATGVSRPSKVRQHKPAAMTGMASALTRILSGESVPSTSSVSTVPRLARKRVRIRAPKSVQSVSSGDEGCDTVSKAKKPAIRVDPVSLCHAPPDPSSWDHEKRLQRIATKGVVQVFNAVYKQQHELNAKLKSAGASETRRSKVLKSVDKGSFLDMLKGAGRKQSSSPSPSEEDNEEPSWPLLRDSFPLKSTMKHYNSEDEC